MSEMLIERTHICHSLGRPCPCLLELIMNIFCKYGVAVASQPCQQSDLFMWACRKTIIYKENKSGANKQEGTQ